LLWAWLQTLPRVLEKVKIKEKAVDEWLNLNVKNREQLTNDVVKLELESITTHALPAFQAGAYIDIQIPGGQLRPYSLCNAPQERHRYVIAVRKEKTSRGASVYLHDRVKVGDVLRVRHPLNEFPMHPSATYSALFGGGVGIAPLLSMAAELWHRGAGFELHLSARNLNQAPFGSFLQQQPYRAGVHFHWSEQAGGRLDFGYHLSRLSPLSHIYICGPKPYLQDAISIAQIYGIARDRLHFESFS
jgi:vanillate O-demethylase ferredoxin subunit